MGVKRECSSQASLVFILSNKLSVLVSHLELEMGPQFADTWSALDRLGLFLKYKGSKRKHNLDVKKI